MTANEKRKKVEAMVLKCVTILASKVAVELAERTGATWTITPDVYYRDWSLSFACPNAPDSLPLGNCCIEVSSGMFLRPSHRLLKLLLADKDDLNWFVRRVTDSVLSSCFQKHIHGCCWKDMGSQEMKIRLLE